jgi:phosphatidate phosphatase LPIN
VKDYPLPDLSPPSPTLSARSDTSNRSTFARLRHLSLVGSRPSTAPKLPISSSPPQRDSDLKKMSSFERLSNTLAEFTGSSSSMADGAHRSASPASRSSSSLTLAESDEEDEEGHDAQGKRVRRRSMTSMPGSIDEMEFDDPDDEEFLEEGTGEGEYEEDQTAEEDFDEDILAAGEMNNVPFL